QEQARAAFAKLERLPPSPELHELLAEVRTLEDRHDDAVAELDSAIRLAPKDSRLQRLRARALWRAARYDEARHSYDAPGCALGTRSRVQL
ncbi:MAG: tetratricopeptide repeat protein, partial [Bryobacteraceae bacterium]